MQMKNKRRQHRRDFRADYVCEFCGYVDRNKEGYDDTNFHENVIPAMVCPECGEHSEGPSSAPQYPDWVKL